MNDCEKGTCKHQLKRECLEQARASEREKAEKAAYDKWTGQCHICHEPVDIPVCRNCYKDARTDERAKCHAACATRCLFAKRQGQAELAEKIANLIWAHPSYAGTQEDAEELVKDAMNLLASESLEGNHQIAHVNGGSKSKPEKPKKRRRNGYARRL